MKKEKRTVRCLMTALFALWGGICTMHGQTAAEDTAAYKEALMELMAQSGNVSQFKDATDGFKKMVTAKFSSSAPEYIQKMSEEEKGRKADSLVAAYFSTQINTDMADVFLPEYMGTVSLEQLKDYNRQLKDQRTATALRHSTETLNNPQAFSEWTEALQDIVSGKTAAPLTAKDCPPSYKAAFEEYFKTYNVEPIISNTIKPLESLMAQNSSAPEAEKAILSNLMKYIGDNMKTFIFNNYVGNVTEDDLKALCELQQSPSSQAIMKVSQNMAARIMPITYGLLTRFDAWTDRQL